MKVKTRFAPSPTGNLHVGNVRTALINYILALKMGGDFILRIDDTDLVRSKKEYEDSIVKDLKWLGFNWNEIYHQSKRLDKYEIVKNNLINAGRLYECFETQEELEIKRRFLLSSGKPPIYDRSALKLTKEQKKDYINIGRKPHYRFKLNEGDIEWIDLIKGRVHFNSSNLSDPILIREDGSMTYMLCSTVDDSEMGITHIIRGEDHVSNTAIQVQLFEAIGSYPPEFGHLSLVKSKDSKISKRDGGYEISSLREDKFIDEMAVNSFFSNLGTSNQIIAYKSLQELVDNFDIANFSKSPTTYLENDLEILNHKLLIQLEFNDVKDKLSKIGLNKIDANFWNAIRPNLKTIMDAKYWWDICHNYSIASINTEDKDFLISACELLPEGILNEGSWKIWTALLKQKTGRSGKNLFMPLRQVITGMTHGPELNNLLPLIGRDEIINRIKKSTNV